MSKSIVITTTNVTVQKYSDKFKAALEKAKDFDGVKVIDAPIKGDARKTVEVGRYLHVHDKGFTVYSVDAVDLVKAFDKADEVTRRRHFEDGFKRSDVNRPNHEYVLNGCGLVEKGGVREGQLLKKAIDAGVKDIGILKNLCPNMTEDMIKAALA